MDTPVQPVDDVAKKPDEIANAEADAALAPWIEQQDAKNLVPFFLAVEEHGEKWLKKLADVVIEDRDTAWDGSEEYRQKRQRNYALLSGTLPKRDSPWPGCANAHMPVFLERYLRLTANVYVELFTDREVLFNVTPTGPDDMEEAEILTLHGNWQLRNELTDFARQQARGVGEFFGSGSVFAHSYRDPVKNRNRHDVLNCEELFLPYVWTTVETDLSDVPYKGRHLRKYRNEIETLGLSGEWAQTQKLIDKGPPAWDVIETKVRDKVAETEGIRAPEQNKRAPYVLYEYHGFYRMPGEDRERPICATVDMHSRTVVKLYLREENDWRDEMRFNRQSEELALHQQEMQRHEMEAIPAYQQAMAEHAQIQEQEAALRAVVTDPMAVDPESGMAIADAIDAEPLEPPQAPIAPPPPAWLKPGMTAPDPIRRVPIEMFSHGVCFENPNGTLGLSPGHILADLNRLTDESLNHFYDAAMMANSWTVVVPEGFDMGSSSVPMAPGKVHRIKNFTGEQIKNAIHEFRAGPANQQLMEIVRLVGENADSSVSAPGVMSGEPGKSGETYRGGAQRLAQATKQLSQAGLMYCDFLGNILKNNARLNALFMPEDELLQVGNHFAEARKLTIDPMTGQPKSALNISREMYRRDYSVSFTADLRFSSQEQKISQLDEVLAMIMQMPPLQANNAFVYDVLAKSLRARGMADLIPMLGPPPPPPAVPFGSPPPPVPGAVPPGAEGGGPAPGPEEGGPPPEMQEGAAA
jgi:hypothetical protein